jgi:hypothetical protein
MSATLDAVLTGPCFEATELPAPTAEERELPADVSDSEDQASFFDD